VRPHDRGRERRERALPGANLDDLCQLKAEEVEGALEWLPEDRKHAAEIVAGALRAAARDHLSRGRRGV